MVIGALALLNVPEPDVVHKVDEELVAVPFNNTPAASEQMV